MEYKDKILTGKEDFDWYKKSLDVATKYNHRHNGEPERYPCKVISSFWDDPNGPYTYDHSFVYKQETKCSHCGHSEMIWPDQVGDVAREPA